MVTAAGEAEPGVEPLVHATRTNMSAEVLGALLEYLGRVGLVAIGPGGRATLTDDGRALLEFGDGVLQMVRAYQPVLESLLAAQPAWADHGQPSIETAFKVAEQAGLVHQIGIVSKSMRLLSPEAGQLAAMLRSFARLSATLTRVA